MAQASPYSTQPSTWITNHLVLTPQWLATSQEAWHSPSPQSLETPFTCLPTSRCSSPSEMAQETSDYSYSLNVTRSSEVWKMSTAQSYTVRKLASCKLVSSIDRTCVLKDLLPLVTERSIHPRRLTDQTQMSTAQSYTVRSTYYVYYNISM